MNTDAPPPAARIWLLLGDKPGDNAQVEVVAEALGLPFELRRVIPRAEFVLGKPRVKASLHHLDPNKSDRLEPPWPDLVLTIGRRPTMAALWVQEQSAGHTRIVLFGPPKRWPERFSLVIAPAQYRLPGAGKLLSIRFPLMRNKEAEIDAARSQWQERLDALRKPITALLVGGQTKPYRLDEGYARDLVARALQLAAPGTLYVSTSRRTPPSAVDAIRSMLPAGSGFFRWAPDAPGNPYMGLLALADRFIVTGDSISMMVEVARQGKPLAIAALPYRSALAQRTHRWLNASAASTGIAATLRRMHVLRGARDLSSMHRVLYDEGLAQPLDAGFSAGGRPLEDELPRVVAAIRGLLQL